MCYIIKYINPKDVFTGNKKEKQNTCNETNNQNRGKKNPPENKMKFKK